MQSIQLKLDNIKKSISENDNENIDYDNIKRYLLKIESEIDRSKKISELQNDIKKKENNIIKLIINCDDHLYIKSKLENVKKYVLEKISENENILFDICFEMNIEIKDFDEELMLNEDISDLLYDKAIIKHIIILDLLSIPMGNYHHYMINILDYSNLKYLKTQNNNRYKNMSINELYDEFNQVDDMKLDELKDLIDLMKEKMFINLPDINPKEIVTF